MKLVTCLPTLLFALLCLSLPSTVAAGPEGETKREGRVDADPALWVFRDEDTTIYLFGTVHLLKPGFSWFDDGIAKAFDSSDELMMEILPFEDKAALGPVIMQLAQDPSGRTMAQRLSADDHAAYKKRLNEMGVATEQLESFEPWFVSMTVMVIDYLQRGFSMDSGAEKVLENAAKSASKTISAFETAEEQMRMLDSIPEAEQVAGLMAFVRNGEELMGRMDKLIAHWAAGEAEAAGKLLNAEMAQTPESARIILTDRNKRWAEQLIRRLDKPGTVFVAVGTGHLIGDDSVQSLLRARGIEVEQVH